MEEAAPAGVAARGKIKFRVPHGRGARRCRSSQAAQELHFWGFTLQMELRRSGWLLQTLYLLSGHKTPGPLVMPAGNSGGSDPPRGETVPQQGGGKHRIPFKTSPFKTESPLKHLPPSLPNLISKPCPHSPCTAGLNHPP